MPSTRLSAQATLRSFGSIENPKPRTENTEFLEYLLKIGNGHEGIILPNGEEPGKKVITIPSDLLVHTLEQLIDFVFGAVTLLSL